MVSDPSATVSTRAVICAIAFEPKQSSEVGLHSCARLCQVAKSSWPIVCVQKVQDKIPESRSLRKNQKIKGEVFDGLFEFQCHIWSDSHN